MKSSYLMIFFSIHSALAIIGCLYYFGDLEIEPISLNIGYRVDVGNKSYNGESKIFHKGIKISSRKEDYSMNVGNKSFKIILIWNKYWNNLHIGMSQYGIGGYKRYCPLPACYLTANKSLSSRASAIIFHDRNEIIEDFPPHVDKNQLYVYLIRESPQFIRRRDTYGDQYNLTMNYRLDSDLPIPHHGFIKPRKKPLPEPKQLKPPFYKRSGLVAWIVSHCKTSSKREKYVAALQKYIKVDIYGHCGPLSCHTKKGKGNCYGLVSNYKFYLSFENSFCNQYVTEKFEKILLAPFDVVPVVYGRANYSSVLTPGSYIDIRDYKSPRNLAQHLLYLSQNEKAYRQYLQWKRFHKYISVFTVRTAMCKLCRLINAGTVNKWYPNVHSWYRDGACDDDFVTNVERMANATLNNEIAQREFL